MAITKNDKTVNIIIVVIKEFVCSKITVTSLSIERGAPRQLSSTQSHSPTATKHDWAPARLLSPSYGKLSDYSLASDFAGGFRVIA